MEPRSIIFVTVDCLRADHTGFLGYNRPTTPFLDTLAKNGMTAKAVVAGAPTYYSFPALLASRPPLALGRDIVGLAPGEVSLAAVLKQAGYSTAAFSAANPYLSPRFGYDQGFDFFRDFLDSTPPPQLPSSTQSRRKVSVNSAVRRSFEALGMTEIYNDLYFQYCQRVAIPPAKSLDALRRFPAADVIVDLARSWLVSQQGPFFLWLHFMDPHSPYYPAPAALVDMGDARMTPQRARYVNESWNRSDISQRKLGQYRDEVVTLYDAGIRWVDRQLGRLVEMLRQTRRWDNCLFAFTADHGEEFLDHGGRYHAPVKATEELIRVPLLLHGAGLPSFAANAPFALLNLAPTLLEGVGLESPPEFYGRSQWQSLLHAGLPEEAVVIECVDGCTNPFYRKNRLGSRLLAICDARYKLVLRFGTGEEVLYDLQADPREQSPLERDVLPDVRGHLLRAAFEHLRRTNSIPSEGLRLAACVRDLRLELTSPHHANADHVA